MSLSQANYFRIDKSFLLDSDFENIQKEVEAGYIRKASHPEYRELSIYNYTDKCTFEEHWNKWTRMCRGLVVNDKTQEVIIWCIPKFFNQGEPCAAKVDFMNSDITLKEDGYMIQFTYHEDYGLVVTSRGSFDSKYAQFVYDYLKDKVTTTSQSGVRYSYMLELCKDFPGDESIIVTKHPKDRLVCWAATDLIGGEVDLRGIGSTWLPEGIEIVKSFTPEEAKKYLKGEVEGVVLRNREYPNERVKVKTDWFLKMHRLISNCTKKRVWEIIKDKSTVDSLEGIPDEFMKQMLSWEKELRQKIEDMYQDAHANAQIYEDWSDKELGIKQPLDSISMKLLWMIRKDKEQQALDFIINYIGKNLNEDNN